MKILEEYIVINDKKNLCKFILIEDGRYFEQMPIGGKYEERTENYFYECVVRMMN